MGIATLPFTVPSAGQLVASADLKRLLIDLRGLDSDSLIIVEKNATYAALPAKRDPRYASLFYPDDSTTLLGPIPSSEGIKESQHFGENIVGVLDNFRKRVCCLIDAIAKLYSQNQWSLRTTESDGSAYLLNYKRGRESAYSMEHLVNNHSRWKFEAQNKFEKPDERGRATYLSGWQSKLSGATDYNVTLRQATMKEASLSDSSEHIYERPTELKFTQNGKNYELDANFNELNTYIFQHERDFSRARNSITWNGHNKQHFYMTAGGEMNHTAMGLLPHTDSLRKTNPNQSDSLFNLMPRIVVLLDYYNHAIFRAFDRTFPDMNEAEASVTVNDNGNREYIFRRSALELTKEGRRKTTYQIQMPNRQTWTLETWNGSDAVNHRVTIEDQNEYKFTYYNGDLGVWMDDGHDASFVGPDRTSS